MAAKQADVEAAMDTCLAGRPALDGEKADERTGMSKCFCRKCRSGLFAGGAP